MKNIHVSLLPVLACIAATLLLLNLNPAANNKPDADGDGKKERPYSFGHKVKKLRKVPAYKMKPTEAEMEAFEENLKKRKKTIYEVDGKYMRIDGNPESSGLWEDIPGLGRVWRLKICAPGAKGVGFSFRKFKLPEGGRFFFYNKDRTHVVGPVSRPDLNSNRLNISGIPGEEVIVEYNQPAGAEGAAEFEIGGIIYRFADFPKSFSLPVEQEVPFVVNPLTPQAEEHLKEIKKIDPMKYGATVIGLEARNDIGSMGVWNELPNGDKLWRLGIKLDFASSFAISIKVPFPENIHLYAYTPNKAKIAEKLKRTSDGKWVGVPSLQNNEMILEYYEPKGIKVGGNMEIHTFEVMLSNLVENTSGAKLPIENCTSTTCIPNTICFDDGYAHSGKKT